MVVVKLENRVGISLLAPVTSENTCCRMKHTHEKKSGLAFVFHFVIVGLVQGVSGSRRIPRERRFFFCVTSIDAPAQPLATHLFTHAK